MLERRCWTTAAGVDRTLRARNDMGNPVGWDPTSNPNAPKDPADTVLLTYVLNVIDHREERAAVLADAATSRSELVVSTRSVLGTSSFRARSGRTVL